MLTKEAQSIQALIASEGWLIFKSLVLGPGNPPHNPLKDQLTDKLMTEARNGHQVEASRYAGQIDILPVVLMVPQKFLDKEQGLSSFEIKNLR